MAFSLGIVGLPNVGKSTLFNALTKNNVLAANYPFATIEPNVGIVPLPDKRLKVLAGIYSSEKILPAPVTFVDIAGIVRGASVGEGLGNKFLANIRESNAIVQVVRVFHDDNVIHVDGKVSPKDDIETIHTELILADLQTIESRLGKLEGEARRDPKGAGALLEAMNKAKTWLNGGNILFGSKLDLEPLRELHLMSTKPFIYVFNLDESQLSNEDLKSKLTALAGTASSVFLCAKIEAELMDLPEDDATELLESLGQNESGLAQLAHVGFTTLGLQTYLTAGPKETRAWTIPMGATAPEAAGVIHSDFQKGFIKAEIVAFNDLAAAGSMGVAKANGKVRLEGKDYIMADGDVVEFRFNV